jgi:hypothetical protein
LISRILLTPLDIHSDALNVLDCRYFNRDHEETAIRFELHECLGVILAKL